MFNFEFSNLPGSFKFKSFGVLFFSILISSACNSAKSNDFIPNEKLKGFPPVTLWAWERPEDLRFLDTQKFGVAFLAQTLVLQNDEVTRQPRRQPLEVAPKTFLIAVTRIETNKTNQNLRPALSDAQRDQIVNLITQTRNLPNVRAIQIDFDVMVSERNFYQMLVRELRSQLPPDVSLTITALASWCIGDSWLAGLPVDEAVPMAFQMGADDKTIREYLASENDWREPLCKGSYGIALDEPLKANFYPNRRFYIFNNRAWRAEDLKRLPKEISQ